MSALPPKADITEMSAKCHKQTFGVSYSITSSASARKRGRNSEAKRLGGLKIDHKLKLRWLHDRKISRLFAFEDPAGTKVEGKCLIPSRQRLLRSTLLRWNPVRDATSSQAHIDKLSGFTSSGFLRCPLITQ